MNELFFTKEKSIITDITSLYTSNGAVDRV
jgi:hypothetical protein